MIFSGAQRNLRSFFAELEALEEIADVLAEAVAFDVQGIELVNKLTTKDCCFVANGDGFGATGILIIRAVAKEKIGNSLGRVDRFNGLDAVLFAVAFEEVEDAIGEATGMRQIERDVEMRHASSLL